MALLTALLLGCGGGGGGGGSAEASSQVNTGESLYQAWNQSINYASSLVRCARAKTQSEACTVGELPPLGTVYGRLTVDLIAERLVTSHRWMGDNFVAAIRTLPEEDLLIFRSVTAIVIGHDIRPSFYTSLNGAIHLDGAFLWTNAEEAADLDTNTDPRLAFAKDLTFIEASRYLNPGFQRLTVPNLYKADSNNSRTIDQLSPSLLALVAHELAHAADFLPPEELGRLDSTLTVFANVARFPGLASDQLHQTYPLNSLMLHGLAGVFFQGKTATDQQKLITAAQVGAEFETEGANDLYAYSSASGGGVLYEDTAMLFEEIMMRRWFDAHRDLAFLERPATDSTFCNDFIIGWGQRNRMADPSVQVRAKLISDRLLPDVDLSDDYASYSTATTLSRTDWCDSNISSTGAAPALQLFNNGRQVREEVIIPMHGH
ncbi:hypothetical protein [Marinobacterium jannaschii]|uniref:hypothetical protein n=1 Tax=Marinobacterium jannaschii TaxID=64970 RepID=UPI00048769B6|nr:hypothetical protein [Marinobacterium jannaschii]